MRVLGQVFKDDYAEERKLWEYTQKLQGTYEEYHKEVDALNIVLQKQEDAQQRVNDIMADETSTINQLSEAKADLKVATDELVTAEENFFIITAKVVRVIASLSEDLDIYMETLGKLDAAEDKYANELEDKEKIMDEIIDIQEELNDAVARYGLGSEEVTDIEGKLNEKHKDLAESTLELIQLKGELNDEVETEIELLASLGQSEFEVATMGKKLINTEEEYKDALVKRTKLEAKQNILLAARNNFERYFNERVNLLRDAESKLYAIELKIYKLRHGSVDSMRELFKALTGQGAVTDELIESYKNMEVAEGNSLKEHVEYVQVLDELNDENRRSVTAWTAAYVDGLDAGMAESEAFTRANEKTGKTLNNVSGITDDYIKEILEYGKAQHLANKYTNEFRGISMGLSNDLIDSGQASIELATAYYQAMKNEHDLETETYNLVRAQATMDSSIYGLIASVGKLYKYYDEFGDLQGDLTAITLAMVDSMKLTDAAGNTEMSVLSRLNSFYGISNQALSDYSKAEIVAALSAMKLAESMEGVSASTITKEDIVDQLPIDDFSEFGSIATDVMLDVNEAFDDLATNIDNLTTAINAFIETLGEIPDDIDIDMEEPPTSAWQDFLQTMKDGVANIEMGKGARVPIWMKAISPLAFVPDIVDAIMRKSESGVIAAAHGITKTKGPMSAIIGENGAEAVVPLEGINRKYGRRILEEILPKYYPDLIGRKLHMQRGGIAGSSRGSIPVPTTTIEKTEIVVHGDIIVQNPANYDDFYDELLRRLGKSKRLVP